jgi:S-adenosylmethionine hydrolase
VGVNLELLGAAVEPASLVNSVPERRWSTERSNVRCSTSNRFGNVLLNVREPQLAESGLEEADAIQIDATSGSGRAGWVSTYSDVASGDWGLIVDPRGWLLVIRGNPANAAEGLGSVSPATQSG